MMENQHGTCYRQEILQTFGLGLLSDSLDKRSLIDFAISEGCCRCRPLPNHDAIVVGSSRLVYKINKEKSKERGILVQACRSKWDKGAILFVSSDYTWN